MSSKVLRLLSSCARPALCSAIQRNTLGNALQRLPKVTKFNTCFSLQATAYRSTLANPALSKIITQTVPTTTHSLKILFGDDHHAYDFKYVWLRDNCKCDACVHPTSKQKLVDTAMLDANIKPSSFSLSDEGFLNMLWDDGHTSNYDPNWLYKYGKSFTLDSEDVEHGDVPAIELWDRVQIWQHMPEVSYREVMETEGGLKTWLDMIHKYGMAILRNVPCNQNEIINVANRFAYVKNTIWGPTFDVICKPVQSDPSHLAYTGMHLEHHTDMNYREKSPGLQMLHCLTSTGSSGGGESFFVDGFYIAKWLQETQPSAFHILSSTPVKFAIKSHEMAYSQTIPVIVVGSNGEIQEIHYNNRTLAPLQMPSHLILPFYHGYKLFASKMREKSTQLSFQMMPGDLVAFNNRRVLHGRTQFDPTKVNRHLQGCYIDIDEVFTRYKSMLSSI